MAYAEKRGDAYRGGYRDATGKKRYIKGSFPKKKDALQAATREEARIARSTADARLYGVTWGQWCEEWWDRRSIERSTETSERSMLDKHIIPYWAGRRVREISRPDVQEWANILADKLKPGTARRILTVFVSSMSGAVSANIIDVNTATGIKLPPVPKGREVFLTREEFAKVISFMPSSRDMAVAQMLVGTGMRWGELAGLHWHNLDLEAGMVTIADTFDRTVIKPYPKSRKPRTVPFFPWAAANLEKPENVKPCIITHTDGVCRSGLVFPTATGGALSDRNYARRAFAPALEKAKLAGLGATLHDLRHTYASWVIQSGVPLERIAELLGHSSVTTTKIYAHLAPAQHDDLRAALGAAPTYKPKLRAVS